MTNVLTPEDEASGPVNDFNYEVVCYDIAEERERQDKKWGQQNHDPALWLAILQEEIGEFSQEALTHRFAKLSPAAKLRVEKKLYEECVQVAAVAQAMCECLKRGSWKWPTQ